MESMHSGESMKKKVCRICHDYFEPQSGTQRVCSFPCAIKLVEENKAKAKKKERRKKKQEFNDRDKSYQRKKAQEIFNRYIRERDKDLPCISCGRHHDGQYHAGHFRSTGSAPHLRFNEDNVHKQCSPCNNYLSGNLVQYRSNLIRKIGIDRVEKLEEDNTYRKYTIDDYKKIIEKYKLKLKEIQNGQHSSRT